MAGNEQYSTIDKVIQRALVGRGDESLRYYAQAFVHARRLYETEYVGAAEASYGHRTRRLEVQADRTVDLPSDYVDYCMVGVRVGEQLVNLLHNAALVQIPEAEAGHTTAAGQGHYYTYTNLINDGVDTLVGWGYPGLRAGHFTINRADRLLLVSSAISPGTILYLHYISNDAAMGKATPIHPLAVGWFEFYMLDYLHRRREPGLAAQYRQDATDARRLYLAQRSNLSVDLLYDVMNTTLGVGSRPAPLLLASAPPALAQFVAPIIEQMP